MLAQACVRLMGDKPIPIWIGSYPDGALQVSGDRRGGGVTRGLRTGRALPPDGYLQQQLRNVGISQHSVDQLLHHKGGGYQRGPKICSLQGIGTISADRSQIYQDCLTNFHMNADCKDDTMTIQLTCIRLKSWNVLQSMHCHRRSSSFTNVILNMSAVVELVVSAPPCLYFSLLGRVVKTQTPFKSVFADTLFAFVMRSTIGVSMMPMSPQSLCCSCLIPWLF